MSLFKQLLIAISFFALVIFCGSFVVTLESSRDQYNNQLLAHAQDAATALGLSLTPHIDDPAMIELMVSSIFDSGYYTSIQVIDQASGKTLFQRNTSVAITDVPSWFVSLTNIQPHSGNATIMRGWKQAAVVEVTSSPMFAVRRLWDATVGNFVLMLTCTLLCLLAGALLLRRQLRPLNYIAKQSEAITRREYLTQPELPKTPELRRVVEAMNLMVTRLKSLFEEQALNSERLHNEAYLDSQTGIANRRAFDMQLLARLSDEEIASGYLLLIRVQDLGGLNQRFGGPHTDKLLQDIATILSSLKARYAAADSLVARIRGGEFALLCPGMNHAEIQSLQHELRQNFASLYTTGMSHVAHVAHIGIVPFSQGEEPQALMVKADRALVEAEAHLSAPLPAPTPAAPNAPAEDQHLWFTRLNDMLERRQFQLFGQPVVACQNPNHVLHHKVLSRIIDDETQGYISAGRFLPWIQRFGWSHRLDRLMLQMTLEQLKHHDSMLALTISGSSLIKTQTMHDLLSPLKQVPQLARRLILELEEHQLPEPEQIAQFVKATGQYGCHVGIQHFGSRFDMIGHFSQWGLAYLKIDNSYIRNIDTENDKRLYIEVLYSAAKNIDLPLIAERVETQNELDTLKKMGIYGAMGQLLGDPAPL